MTIRTTLSAMLAGAAVLAATFLAAAPVLAHARYKSSTPGKGEVLAASPARVEITFTQQLQKISGTYGIEVNRDRGAAVTSGPAVLDETDRSKLSVPLQADLQPGRYVVHWKNVSDADGDPATGALSFYVNKQPNAVDLQNDKQLEQIGFEPETPAAGTTPAGATPAATTPAGTTPAAGETPKSGATAAASTAARPTAATTGTREPAISAATPGPTPASTNNDSGSNTGLYIIVAAAAIAGIIVGFGAWQYTARRRR